MPTVVYMNDRPSECCICESETKLCRAYVVALAAEEKKPFSFFSGSSTRSGVSLQRPPISLKGVRDITMKTNAPLYARSPYRPEANRLCAL